MITAAGGRQAGPVAMRTPVMRAHTCLLFRLTPVSEMDSVERGQTGQRSPDRSPHRRRQSAAHARMVRGTAPRLLTGFADVRRFLRTSETAPASRRRGA